MTSSQREILAILRANPSDRICRHWVGTQIASVKIIKLGMTVDDDDVWVSKTDLGRLLNLKLVVMLMTREAPAVGILRGRYEYFGVTRAGEAG